MADGKIDIDLVLNDQTDKTWTDFKSKAESSGKEGYETFKKSFGDEPLVAKLEAKANKEGIADFKSLLNDLPEEKQTELLAKAEKGEAIEFEKYIENMPKKKVVSLETQAKNAGIDNFDKLLKKLPKETVTDLQARAEKGEVINFEQLLYKIPSKYITQLQLNDNASGGLRNIQREAEETTKKFNGLKSIIGGSFIGNVAASGFNRVTGYLGGLVKEAGNASDAMQGFDATMQLAGFGEAKIKSVGQEVKKYADDTVYDLQDVSNTTAQLAANGVDNFEKLTESAGNLTAVAGGTKDDFKSVAMVMTQTAGAGKLTTENWNQLTDAIPGASGKLQEAMKKNGAFTGNFRDAMEKGQISADEFNKAIDQLGSTDKAKKFAKGTAEFQGAFGNLEAEVVNGWQKIIDAIGKKNITDVINGLASVASKAFGAVAKGVDLMGDGLAKLKDHPVLLATLTTAFKALGTAIAIFAGAKGALTLISSVKKIGTAFSALTTVLAANPFLAIVAAVAGITVALVSLYKHNKKFREFVDGLVDSAHDFFEGVGKWFGQAWKSISGFFSKVFNFVKKDWKEILLLIVSPFAGAFALIYKHNKKFRESINNLVKAVINYFNNMSKNISRIFTSIKEFMSNTLATIKKNWEKGWRGVSSFFSNIWNSMKKFFSNILDWFVDTITSSLKAIQKIWNKVWDSISDFFSDIWKGIKKTASNAWDWMSDKLIGFGTNVSKTWTNMWSGIRDFFSDIWDDIKRLAKDGMNGIIGFINTGVGGINGVIHNFGGKKETIKPLKKLATGTDGAPSGLAMVNDGFDSPTGQELIIDNQGQATILSGRNRLVNFEGGETVVPANVTHAMLGGHTFANGTKDWFGGVKSFFGDVAEDISDAISSATGKAKEFLGIAMHPVKYIEDKVFSPMTKGISGLAGSAISSLGSAVSGSNGVQGQQNNWWHELWNMLKDTISGSGGNGGIGDDYRFKNKQKDEGMPSGDPWGYFFRECVSFVASRLANVGVKPSLFTGLGNGSNWTSARVKHKSTPSVGDIAVYSNGSKYGNHVSVVTGVNNGRYSEEGYNYAGNGKYYKSGGLKFSDATTFLNFGKSAAKSAKSDSKKDSPLQKLIRSQVGGMFDWVSDMMSNLLGSFNGGGEQASGPGAKPSGGHKNWLKQAGIHDNFDKWNYIISHESGWNPKAKNPSSDAYGIGQALPPSKMAGFGSDYMSNPITQLKWMKSYVKERYGGINGAYDFWQRNHWYANGGRTNGVGLVGEVDGEDEWVINPNRRSADETILGSIRETAEKQPNSFAAKLAQVVNTAKSGSQSNMIAQSSHGTHVQRVNQTNGGIDLSGDVHMVVQLDSGEVAKATYPKIKLLQNQDIQLKGQATGNIYGY